MKKFLGKILALCAVLFVVLALSFPQQAVAADVRTGEHILIPESQTNLEDLYLFGSDIRIDAPVTNDVVIGGGDIAINEAISNDLLVAGGTVSVNGAIGNTARIAGGTITIDRPIANDLVIAGGTITLTKNASIGGDVLIAGGTVTINAPTHGNILMSGGDMNLNSTVGGDVRGGQIGTLTLGPQAKIDGNLSYTSDTPAQQLPGSMIAGKTTFHQSQTKQEEQSQALTSFIKTSLYKLAIDIILTVLLIYFFKQGLVTLFAHMKKSPVKSGGIGLLYLIAAPIASFFGLALIWLGFASFLVYALMLIISIFLAKIFLGWLLLRWWENRQKHTYALDWKAGVAGSIILFLLLLIPVLGWIVAAIVFCIALGAFIELLLRTAKNLKGAPKK